MELNVETKIGSTALNVALSKGHDDVVRLLMEHTARVPDVDEMCVPIEVDVMDCGISDFSPFQDIMNEDLSPTHDWMDWTARTIGANERTAAPPHRVVKVLDESITERDVLAGR